MTPIIKNQIITDFSCKFDKLNLKFSLLKTRIFLILEGSTSV